MEHAERIKTFKRRKRVVRIKKLFEPVAKSEIGATLLALLLVPFYILPFTHTKLFFLVFGGLIAMSIVLVLVFGFFKVRHIFLLNIVIGIIYLLYTLDRQGIFVIKENTDNIFSELFGLLFDIILFGLIIVYYDNIVQDRNTMNGYLEDIEDLKGWKSTESKYRIVGRLKRLRKFKRSVGSLSDFDFSGMDLNGIYLESSFLKRCDFSNTEMSHIKAKKCQGGHSKFEYAKGEDTDFYGASLHNCLFQNAKFSLSDFSECNLSSTDFSDAEFFHCMFFNAFARGASFKNSNLQVSDFSFATLYRVDFSNANLSRCKFEKAILGIVNFSGADLRQTDFKKVKVEADYESGEVEFRINLDNARVSNQEWLSEWISHLNNEVGAFLKDTYHVKWNEDFCEYTIEKINK